MATHRPHPVPAAFLAPANLPAVLLALLLFAVTAAGWRLLAQRRAFARLRQRAGCAPLRILPSGGLHLLMIKSRKHANALTCVHVSLPCRRGVARGLPASCTMRREAQGSSLRESTLAALVPGGLALYVPRAFAP